MTITTPSIEQLLANKSFKIAAGGLWVVLFAVAMGFLVAAKAPTKLSSLGPSLPERAYNIPLLRSLPEPEPMVARGAKPGSMRGARTMLSRR